MDRDDPAATEIGLLKQKGLLGVVQPSQLFGSISSGKNKVATAMKWKVCRIEFGESQRSLRRPVKDFVLNITSSKSGKVKGSYALSAHSFCAIVRLPLPPLAATVPVVGGGGTLNRKATVVPIMCLLNDRCQGVALREHASDTVKLENWYRSIVETLVGLDKYVQLPVLDTKGKECIVHVTPYNVSVTPREPIATMYARDHRIWQASAVSMTICQDSNCLSISPPHGPPIAYRLQEGGCSTSVVATVQKLLCMAVDWSGGQLAQPLLSPSSSSTYGTLRRPSPPPSYVRSASAEPPPSNVTQNAAQQQTLTMAVPTFATMQRSQPRPPLSLPTEIVASSDSGGAVPSLSHHFSPRPLPRRSRDAPQSFGLPDIVSPSGGAFFTSANIGPAAIANAEASAAAERRDVISPRPVPRAVHVAPSGTGGGVGSLAAASQASLARSADGRPDAQQDGTLVAGNRSQHLFGSGDAARSRTATPCGSCPSPAPRRSNNAVTTCGTCDIIPIEVPRPAEDSSNEVAATAAQSKLDVGQQQWKRAQLESLQNACDISDTEDSSGSSNDSSPIEREPPHLAGPGTLLCSAAEDSYDPDVDIYESYEEGANESLYENLHDLYGQYVNAPNERLKPALPPRRQKPVVCDDGCGSASVLPPPLPLRRGGARSNIAATLDRIIDRVPPSAGCDPFGLKSHVRRDFCWQLALKDSISGSWQDLAARAIELTTEEIGMIEKFSKDYRFPPPEIVLHHWQYLHFVKCNDMIRCQPTRSNLVSILLDLGREDLVEFLNNNR